MTPEAEAPLPAYAPNWRTVLLVDGALGAAVFVVGVVLMLVWSVFAGAAVGAFGATYTLLVARRARRWAALRRAAGL